MKKKQGHSGNGDNGHREDPWIKKGVACFGRCQEPKNPVERKRLLDAFPQMAWEDAEVVAGRYIPAKTDHEGRKEAAQAWLMLGRDLFWFHVHQNAARKAFPKRTILLIRQQDGQKIALSLRQ